MADSTDEMGLTLGRTAKTATVLALCALLLLGNEPATVQAAEEAPTRLEMEQQMARLINRARRKKERRPLDLRARLSDVARDHSRRMKGAGTIFHSTLSKTVGSFAWRVAGENVGVGPSIESLHTAFMNSPGHRANVLYRDYDRVGVGVVRAGDTIYITILFLG